MNAEPTPEPPAKQSKLFACYDTAADIQQTAPTSAEAQMTMYLNLCSQQRPVKTVSNFGENTKVTSINCDVPATSAAVERVFSHGGLVMKPHRARMSDKLLSNLILLKCNM